MRSDEIATKIRREAFIGDVAQFPDYTDTVLWSECNDAVHGVFEGPVVSSRQGYWLKQFFYTTTGGKAKYRIPARSVVGGLEIVEIADASGRFYRLGEVNEQQAQEYELASGQVGPPQVFCIRGDQVVLLPTPDLLAGYTLRLSYYLRPSRLVQQQSSTIGGGTVRGTVTGVNTATRQITVDVVPFDQELAVPAAITSGLQKIDVVHGDGWHEIALVGATQTLSGLVFTVGGTDDLSEIILGTDYVRAQQQTDWPQLPTDFHPTLCGIVAVKLLMQLKLADKAATLAQAVNADIGRFADLMQPRVKNEPPLIKADLPVLRRRQVSIAKYP